ncbi:uncharacterized protein N7473_000470 [Penicillium subrubescens]|uniref:uncharacterized protein n=1 Tax=Penicillium subrubescens TaxID=1316194 RepID=UPI002544EE04|nr:uncharacterized protein N7473_000470 [Penicillium subrubescens]KAJ5911167.1 hypothetical protein N7473_000470 [Penicillium subrubescens]
MDLEETIKAIKPLKGEVVPIRTIQETRPPEDFTDAYVAEVNVKAASKVIKAIDAAFPRDTTLPAMSHLRRFSKRTMLPEHLAAAIEADGSAPANNGQTIFVVIPPPLPEVETLQALLAPFAPLPRRRSSATPPANSPRPSSPISAPGSPEPQPPKIRNNVASGLQPRRTPLHCRTPPQILNRALDSIKPRAGYYLSLARKVAEESKQSGRGRGVGAVIVDPTIEDEIEIQAWEDCTDPNEHWMDAVLSVGGDVRYARSEAGAASQADKHPGVAPNPACTKYDADIEGGPDLHALMRATELVARRRREDGDHLAQYGDSALPVVASDPQLSNKLSPLESYFLYEISGHTTATEHDHTIAPPLSLKKRKHEEPNPESSTSFWAVTPEATTPVPVDQWADPKPVIPLVPHKPVNGWPSTAPVGASTATEPVDLWNTTTPAVPKTTPLPPSSTAPGAPGIPAPTTAHANSSPSNSGTTSPPQTSRIRTRSQGGYLCTDLDIYVSHEPCLCCSMGMLLSRFRAVIFPRAGRMPSGGIASEPVVKPTPMDYDSGWGAEEKIDEEPKEAAKTEDRLYYGLHWRKELNWRALGFEFVEDDEKEDEGAVSGLNDDDENLNFHA